MAHATVRAILTTEVVHLIADKYHLSEDEALDLFYTSRTAAALSDSETGLYGQSALYIFGLFCQEKTECLDERLPEEFS